VNGEPTGQPECAALLAQALELSRRLLAAADAGDAEAARNLDLERLQLLKSARRSPRPMSERDQAVLREIALLNDQSIGHLEHHRRIKGRQLDVAMTGRRAVNAYCGIGQRR
jgi:hypothetical protein